MVDCAFCDIVNREIPAEIIYETPSTLAFFPLEPATLGHTLVIPKQHIENFLDLTPVDIPDLGLTVVTVGHALRAVLAPAGMNVISSAGAAASQTVMHLHVHLVPRWSGDAIGDIWPPKIPTSKYVLDDVADAVREFCQTEALEYRNPKQ